MVFEKKSKRSIDEWVTNDNGWVIAQIGQSHFRSISSKSTSSQRIFQSIDGSCPCKQPTSWTSDWRNTNDWHQSRSYCQLTHCSLDHVTPCDLTWPLPKSRDQCSTYTNDYCRRKTREPIRVRTKFGQIPNNSELFDSTKKQKVKNESKSPTVIGQPIREVYLDSFLFGQSAITRREILPSDLSFSLPPSLIRPWIGAGQDTVHA